MDCLHLAFPQCREGWGAKGGVALYQLFPNDHRDWLKQNRKEELAENVCVYVGVVLGYVVVMLGADYICICGLRHLLHISSASKLFDILLAEVVYVSCKIIKDLLLFLFSLSSVTVSY